MIFLALKDTLLFHRSSAKSTLNMRKHLVGNKKCGFVRCGTLSFWVVLQKYKCITFVRSVHLTAQRQILAQKTILFTRNISSWQFLWVECTLLSKQSVTDAGVFHSELHTYGWDKQKVRSLVKRNGGKKSLIGNLIKYLYCDVLLFFWAVYQGLSPPLSIVFSCLNYYTQKVNIIKTWVIKNRAL